MDYVIGEILLCLLAVAVVATLIGWMLHNVIGQGKMKALQAAKNHEIEILQGKLETMSRAQVEAAGGLEKAIGHLKASEVSLQALTVAQAKHEADAGKLKDQIATLEPLTALATERESRIDVWQKRFEGLVVEKDKALAAGSAQLAEQKSKLTALELSLAAAVAEQESLAARVTEHRTALDVAQGELQAGGVQKDGVLAELRAKVAEHEHSLEAAHAHLQKFSAEKDGLVADLRARLADAEGAHSGHSAKLDDMTALLGQRDEQLKSFDQRMRGAAAEKDTVIGKLRLMVAQIEPLRLQLQQRDEAIEQMQKRVSAAPVAGSSMELEEAQRQINTLLAGSTSMKTALEGKDAEIAGLSAKLESSAATEDRMSMLENQVIDVTGRHAASQGELNDWAAKYAELESRTRQQASEHEAATRSVEDKQTELDKTRAEVASLDTRTMTALTQWKARVAELEQALDEEIPHEAQLRATIASRDAELTELRDQIGHRDDQLAGAYLLQDQVIDVTGRHAAAKGELNDWSWRFEELESRLREQTVEHEAATRSVEAKQVELDKARAEVADLDSKFMVLMNATPDEQVAVLKATIATHETELAGLRAQVAAYLAVTPEAEQSEQDERLQMLENQILDVTGRHAAAKGELDDWGNRYADLEARFRQRGSDQEVSTRSIEARQDALDKSRAEVADLDSKLMVALNAQPADHDIADLRAQIVDRDEQLEAWESRFHASIGELRGEIGMLRARIHSQDAELRETRGQLTAAGFGFVNEPKGGRHSDEDVRQLREILENGLAMHGVQFLPSSAELIPQALPILGKASEALHRYPDVSVEIAGHTDSWGMPHDNLKLSQKRAAAVKEYLINSGIPAWRLLEVGYGDTRPIESNDTADGRFANRRIEFRVKQ